MPTPTYQNKDGLAIDLLLSYTVEAGEAVYILGWLGIVMTDGVSGDTRAIEIKPEERRFDIPNALNPAVGSIIYVDLDQVVGHSIPAAALSTSSSGNKRKLCKTTKLREGVADAYKVSGILLMEEV